MKKTIAAILVTILASAGYVVLDKTAADKIDRLESQVSVQQEVIDRLEKPLDVLEMHTGNTIPCYPGEGQTVRAYVLDRDRTTTWTTTLTTTTTTTTTAKTTEPITLPTGTEIGAIPLAAARAQIDEPTATKPEPTAPTATILPDTTVTTQPTTTPPPAAVPTFPYYLFEEDGGYYYHLRADVLITRFRCEMVGKTLTGLPKFLITLTGKTDRKYAGRMITVRFGDDEGLWETETTNIQPNGTFTVSTEVVLSDASVIPLMQLRID